MKFNHRQPGLSLIEETLVVAIVAVLLFLAVPAAKYLFNMMQTPAGVKAMIGSALNSAKAIAARDQQYVGIRFQHACYKDTQGNIHPEQSPLKMPQYMIFIEYRPPKQIGNTDQDIFTAVEGIEPVKLPENIGVMDLVINRTHAIQSYGDINTDVYLSDTTTFSIVFAPSGKIVVMDVQTRNEDNESNPGSTISKDDIFNTEQQVHDGVAKFLQDDYPAFGLGQEPSRRCFIIYDRSVLLSLPKNERYTLASGQPGYLENLKNRNMIYINPYTGTFINK